MPSPAAASATVAKRREFLGHPAPLYTLFFVEMWERYSFYGMRALLSLFMVLPRSSGGMGLSVANAALIYGTYTCSVYMVGIPGGVLADSVLGGRLAVLLGGLIISAGHFSMAFPSDTTFYLGLTLIVIGTGLLKPNISAMVGQLYAPGDARRDAGFSIFYMGINIGATLSPFVTGFLAQHSWFKERLAAWGFDPNHSWHWGFAAAGVGMVAGVINFLIYHRGLQSIGSPPARPPGFWIRPVVVTALIAVLWGLVWLSDRDGFTWIRWALLVIPVVAMIAFGRSPDPGRQKLAAVCYFFIGGIVFWALYEQAGTSLNLFADQFTVTHVFGVEVPSSWYQGVPSIFVIVLAGAFAVLWVRLGSRQPSSPMKFSIALALLAVSFAVMVPASRLAVVGRVGPIWLLSVYFIQTLGELCLSPVGLSIFTKLAPPKRDGIMLGVWLLGMGLGNKFAGVLASTFGEGDASSLDRFFGRQAIAVFVVAGVFLALVPWVRRRMGNVL
ncbi:MAG TPA: peptide MFS transporter [Candidatus Didemnitutus sp.]|nr:peptide MFS transporter [Candidatus Didemnitutus sp.]